MKRVTACVVAFATFVVGCNALAIGGVAQVTIVDRDTGAVLTPHYYRGEYWVAGRPGANYAVEIHNRLGERVLAVTSVDGVNVVSGETANWNQTGYVLNPEQTYQITGWRKSDTEVAAFTFTDSPNSYAELTGRPANVGVIGVAIFRERPAPRVTTPEFGMTDAPSEDATVISRLRSPDRGTAAPSAAAPSADRARPDAARCLAGVRTTMPDGDFTKHGLLAGDAAPPHRADWTIDQDWERYTAMEHGVWRTLYERQVKLLPGRACDEYLAGMEALPIGFDQIPDFRRLSCLQPPSSLLNPAKLPCASPSWTESAEMLHF